MNEENVKIARIRKSCRVGKKVSNILCIVAIVGCVCALIGTIAIFRMGKNFDVKFNEAKEAGMVSTTSEIGSVALFKMNLGNIPTDLHSDIPAVQEMIEDHPLCIIYGSYSLIAAIGAAILAVMLKLTSSVFALIEKESSPFTDRVRKRVTFVLIATAVLLCFTAGAAFGGLCALIAWAVNAILDYGKTLQTESDETL